LWDVPIGTALVDVEAVDLVQVVEDVGWRGVRIERDRQGGPKESLSTIRFERGTLIPLGDRERLL